MKAVLERLTTVRGVGAAAVLDESGECLAFDGSGRALAVAMSSREIVRGALRANTAPFAGRTQFAIARFQSCTLVVRRMEAGFLVVVGTPDLDMTSLGASFPIAAALKLVTMKMKRAMLEHARAARVAVREAEDQEVVVERPPPIESMVVPSLGRSDDTLPSLDRAPGF